MTMNFAVEGTRIPEFTIGDRLKKARTSAGIAQGEFAGELGVEQRTVTRWEAADKVKRSVVLAYALRTGVPVAWLETGSYTPWDLNPEPTVSGFGRRRNFHLAAVSYLGGADNAVLAA